MRNGGVSVSPRGIQNSLKNSDQPKRSRHQILQKSSKFNLYSRNGTNGTKTRTTKGERERNEENGTAVLNFIFRKEIVYKTISSHNCGILLFWALRPGQEVYILSHV